jgi:O-antigen biosynthesis protein
VTPPALSVVIPTHNNDAVLRRCLTAWQEQAHRERLEIIVVEDGCRDGTPAFLGELVRTPWGARHLRVLHENDVHEQRCTNRGFAEASGSLVLVWQDDMLVTARWFVPELLATFRAHQDLGLLGLTRGLNCHPAEPPIERWEDLTDWRRLPSTIGPPFLNWWRIQEVDFVIRPWVLRREILARVGLLDPAFALSEWDEADLCFRIRQAGWRIGTHGYERSGAYVHLGSTTLGHSFSESYKQQVLRNGLLFHQRWDDEIARAHARHRKAWWRRAPARASAATVAAAARRLLALGTGA